MHSGGFFGFGMDLGANFPLYGSVCDPVAGVNDDQSDLFWLSNPAKISFIGLFAK